MALSKTNPDGTTTIKEKKETFTKLTKHIEKRENKELVQCQRATINDVIYCHDIEWTPIGNGVLRGECKNCKEVFLF